MSSREPKGEEESEDGTKTDPLWGLYPNSIVSEYNLVFASFKVDRPEVMVGRIYRCRGAVYFGSPTCVVRVCESQVAIACCVDFDLYDFIGMFGDGHPRRPL